MRSLALVLLCLTCTGSLAAADHDVCGKISPSRVSDIQWSGSPSATTEHVSYSGAPYNPSTNQHASVQAGDYYTLSAASGTNYQLKQYSFGALKSIFPEGTVKANAEAVFVIIDGWYGTVITKTDHSTRRSDTFTNLQTDPTSTFVEGACLASQATTEGAVSAPSTTTPLHMPGESDTGIPCKAVLGVDYCKVRGRAECEDGTCKCTGGYTVPDGGNLCSQAPSLLADVEAGFPWMVMLSSMFASAFLTAVVLHFRRGDFLSQPLLE